ncbi:MAG: nitroreductase family protein [Actinomycetota bacterium]|nr:nitroreductase family protein [Actinomycetota bacterium]MDD5666556.1 nitroreductase family protein [Actinomycetota bacterium]
MEQTKEPTRDYPSYSSTPWGLWEVLYGRRSHRKYLQYEVGPEWKASLEKVVKLALETRGADGESLLVVTDERLVERIRTRLHKGVQGKINLWLNRSPLLGFLVLALPKQDVRSERPRDLPLTAMAAEDVVLWLTESGMGTCWLGGINQGEIKSALGLGREHFVAAVIPFGKPKPRVKARDLDHLMYRSISRKRKPIPAIACLETIDRPYALPDIAEERFSASSVQDVAGLLRQLREKRESADGVPLDLAVDACLEAARIAPSAGNTQKWLFVAVAGEQALRGLAGACGVDGGWKAAVVGVGDTVTGFLYEKMEKPFWMIDLPIAFSQMSLMAASMGLALDLSLRDIDEAAVNALVGLRPPLRAVGVMGIR